jgi:hypothetical protein
MHPGKKLCLAYHANEDTWSWPVWARAPLGPPFEHAQLLCFVPLSTSSVEDVVGIVDVTEAGFHGDL